VSPIIREHLRPCKSSIADLFRAAAAGLNPQKMSAATKPFTDGHHLNLPSNQTFAMSSRAASHFAFYHRAVWEPFLNNIRKDRGRCANYLL